MAKERWKQIDERPNYDVSSMGNVRNKRNGRVLKLYDDGNGYLRVHLNNRSCRVHILVAVAVAFIPNPENKPIVNHKLGNKHDNRASQLEWFTASENTKHAYDNGLIVRGSKTWNMTRKNTKKELVKTPIEFNTLLNNSRSQKY